MLIYYAPCKISYILISRDKADEETEEKQIFVGSIYQKLSQKLTAGINVMWKQCGGEAGFDLGCSYELDGDATVRAKVDNKVQVGLSYTQRLREGKPAFLKLVTCYVTIKATLYWNFNLFIF